MRQIGKWEGLKPDAARSGERGEENPVPAKQHIPNPLNPGNLKLYTPLEHSDVSGMDSHCLARPKIVRHYLAIEFDPGLAGTRHLLQKKTVTSKDSRSKRLLEPYTQINSRGRT